MFIRRGMKAGGQGEGLSDNPPPPAKPTFPAALHNQEGGVRLAERSERPRRFPALTLAAVGCFSFLHVLYIEIKYKAFPLCVIIPGKTVLSATPTQCLMAL